jgi:hypothetical protein
MLWPIVQIIFGMLNIARCHMRSPQHLLLLPVSEIQHHNISQPPNFPIFSKHDKSSQYPNQNICYVDSMAPAWWMFNLWHQPLSPRGGPKKTPHRLGVQMLLELGGGLAELGPRAMGTMGTMGMPRAVGEVIFWKKSQ